MKLTPGIAAMLLLLPYNSLHAQNNLNNKIPAIQQIHIGDTCPAITVRFLNSTQTTRLLNNKGKIIILDFFSRICGACISGLPKLNALQQKQKDKLQIILVTTEPAGEIQTFFKTNKIAAANTLPVITGDKKLSACFPHTMVPHDVWIDGDGIVRAITVAEDVNEENITALLAGNNFSLPVKEDLLHFDAAKLLLQDDNGGSTANIFFRSTFSYYINGIESKSAIYTDKNFKRYLSLNQPLFGLYQDALGGIAANRMLLQVKDSAIFITVNKTAAVKQLYCYELIAPLTTSITAMRAYMQQDIERSFNITGSFKKQDMQVYALVRTDSNDNILSPATESPFIQFNDADSVKLIRHQPLSVLVNELNDASHTSAAIFTDETGYTAPADITLVIHDVSNVVVLNAQLQPYGLSLKPRQQALNMFVITDSVQTPAETTFFHPHK